MLKMAAWDDLLLVSLRCHNCTLRQSICAAGSSLLIVHIRLLCHKCTHVHRPAVITFNHEV